MPIPNTNRYEIVGDGVTAIVTAKGDRFLIDSRDVETAKRHCWSRQTNGYARAVTRTPDGKKLRTVYLHRLLCGVSASQPHVDHVNGVLDDCRRSNLRACSRSENLRNQGVRRDSRTGLKGVGLHGQTGKYRARVRVDGLVHNLGLFDTPELAAAAANIARSALHGEFVRHA